MYHIRLHTGMYWYWYCKTMVLVCIDKLARLTVIWICDSRIGRRQCCLCVHSISTSMWNIDVCVNTGTFTHPFALSSLLQVRNLTLVTCAARALLLQATTTIISGATVAKSHIGEAPTSSPSDFSIIIVDPCFWIWRNFVQVWLLWKDVHCQWQPEASSQISPFPSRCKRLQHHQLIPSRSSPSEVDLIHILDRVHNTCSSGTHFNRTV